MSQEFNSWKDSHSTKLLKRRPQILVKLSFRELCDSKLSGLHPFDNIVISWVKNKLKIERLAVSSWDTNHWRNFYVTFTENSSVITNDTESIAHVIKHVNFQLFRAYLAQVIRKNWQLTINKSTNKFAVLYIKQCMPPN